VANLEPGALEIAGQPIPHLSAGPKQSNCRNHFRTIHRPSNVESACRNEPCGSLSQPLVMLASRRESTGAPGSPKRTSDFLSSLLALANFMRLSLMKAAHAAVGGAPCRKSGYQGRKRWAKPNDRFPLNRPQPFPPTPTRETPPAPSPNPAEFRKRYNPEIDRFNGQAAGFPRWHRRSKVS
jgi:hypothetical protein